MLHTLTFNWQRRAVLAVLFTFAMLAAVLAAPASAQATEHCGTGGQKAVTVGGWFEGVLEDVPAFYNDGESAGTRDVWVEINGPNISFFDDDTDQPIVAVFCLKSSTVAAGSTGTTGISPATNKKGVRQDISYASLYSVLVPRTTTTEGPGEWCSPGFWKNNPISLAAAADAAGVDYDAAMAAVSLTGPGSSGPKHAMADALSAAVGLDGTYASTGANHICPFAADNSSNNDAKVPNWELFAGGGPTALGGTVDDDVTDLGDEGGLEDETELDEGEGGADEGEPEIEEGNEPEEPGEVEDPEGGPEDGTRDEDDELPDNSGGDESDE